MRHLDEGTIHAWLDGALEAEEGRRVEAHLAECSACAASVREARGLIAASSRILGALDVVPADVVPAGPPMLAHAYGQSLPPVGRPGTNATGVEGAAPRATRWAWLSRTARIAAVVGFVAVSATVADRVLRERPTRATRLASAPRADASAPAASEGFQTTPGAADSLPPRPAAAVPPALDKIAAPRPAETRTRSGAGASVPARESPSASSAANAPTRNDAERAPESATEERVGRPDARAKSPAFDAAAKAIAGAGVARESAPAAQRATSAVRNERPATPASGARGLAATDSAQTSARDTGAVLARSPERDRQALERSLDAVTVTAAGKPATFQDSLAGADSVQRADRAVAADEMETRRDGAPRAVSSRAQLPAGMQLRLISADRVVTADARVVERRVYEVRPGVRITLEQAAALADHQAPIDGRARVPSPVPQAAPAPAAPTELAASATDSAGLNSIQWTDSTGTQFTLTGRLSIEELRRLKGLVH